MLHARVIRILHNHLSYFGLDDTIPMDDIEIVASGCYWAHNEICSKFNCSWDSMGAMTDVLNACNIGKKCFSTLSDNDHLLAFYRKAVGLLANDVESLSSVAEAISAFDTASETGRVRTCFAGLIASIASLAILRFYRQENERPTTQVPRVSVKATVMPKLTLQPWDMSTVHNFQMALPMFTNACAFHEPGSERALQSALVWLRDWVDGHATIHHDICWSDGDPGSEVSQGQYIINRRCRPFSVFWDIALEAITTDSLLGIFCGNIIPQELRGVAVIGTGLVNCGFWSADPYQTLDTAEHLCVSFFSLLCGWACDFDMEGLGGGNVLAFWCPKTRDHICEIAMDRHRSWNYTEHAWRLHMGINIYFVSTVRHFSTIRRTMAYMTSSSATSDLRDNAEICNTRLGEILVASGLSVQDAARAGHVTVERPCRACFSPTLMTELFAITTGIPSICSTLGERGLQIAATVDMLGLALFPAIRDYIAAGCQCGGKVFSSVFIDAFVHCGMGTPSKCLALNDIMRRWWTHSLEQWIKDKAAELGYTVTEHTGRMYEISLVDLTTSCCA